MQPVELENKVALIVGGASEQGESLAISFAERGMDVAIIFYEGEEERAKALAREVEKMGRRCALIRGEGGEKRDEDMFARWAVEQVLERLGRLDVFINVSEEQFPVEALNGDGPQRSRSGSPGLLRDFQILKAALDEIVG